MALKRLVYISKVADSVRVEDAESIALGASRRNAELDITGFLVFSSRYFVQVLEGESDVVDSVLVRIEKDPRHSELRTIGEEPITERVFGDWSMGFTHMGRVADIDPEHWSADQAMELLRELAGV